MKKTTKTTKKTAKARNVCVEIPLLDGWLSMYIGRLVSRTATTIKLVDVSWIASTGRRNLFFAGDADENCEIEPYPDGVKMELPARGALVTEWPHDLPRSVR